MTDESDKPARIGFSVTASGVHYYLTSLKLAPHETRAIDLRQLRDAQVADFKKNKIPADASDGAINWIRLNNVPVSGRVVVMNRNGGIASNYDCNYCNCGSNLSGLTESPSPGFSDVPGMTMDCSCTAAYTDCNGGITYYGATTNASWTSTNTGVATVGNGTTGGQVTGVAGGTATIQATLNGCTFDFSTPYCQCTPVQYSSSSGCEVQKPTFLWPKSYTSPNYYVCLGLGCEIDVYYQVLDANQNPIDVSGMSGAESVSLDSSNTCSGVTFDDSGKWTTDSTGSFTGPDMVDDCSTGGTCVLKSDQYFTVDGYPMIVLNSAKTVSGSHYLITITVSNGQASCPNAGSYYCTAACKSGGYSSPTAFAAIPHAGMCGTGITLEASNGGGWSSFASTTVGDIGPGSTTDDYWFTGSTPSLGGCITDLLYQSLGLGNLGCTGSGCSNACVNGKPNVVNPLVYWRFSN